MPKQNLTGLEKWQLQKFCKDNRIDTHFIDTQITFAENKTALREYTTPIPELNIGEYIETLNLDELEKEWLSVITKSNDGKKSRLTKEEKLGLNILTQKISQITKNQNCKYFYKMVKNQKRMTQAISQRIKRVLRENGIQTRHKSKPIQFIKPIDKKSLRQPIEIVCPTNPPKNKLITPLTYQKLTEEQKEVSKTIQKLVINSYKELKKEQLSDKMWLLTEYKKAVKREKEEFNAEMGIRCLFKNSEQFKTEEKLNQAFSFLFSS